MDSLTPDKASDTVICRICLRSYNQGKFVSLFEPFRGHDAAHYINVLSDINITKDDTLPDKICVICLTDLDASLCFKDKCLYSNSYLKKTPEDTIKVVDKNNSTNTENPNKTKANIENTSSTSTDEEECSDNAKSEGQFLCKKCGKEYKSWFDLKEHRQLDHKPLLFICNICKMTFTSIVSLKRHQTAKNEKCVVMKDVRIDGIGKTRMFYCNLCEFHSRWSQAVTHHMNSHKGEKNFECEFCNKKYSQASALASHKVKVHLDIIVTSCEFCGLKLKGVNKMRQHVASHSNKKYICVLCGQKFNTRQNFAQHLDSHKDAVTYDCSLCISKFYTSKQLKNHMKVKHKEGDLYFQCSFCPVRYMRKPNLDKHECKHTDSNFSCLDCEGFYDSELKLWGHRICHLSDDSPLKKTCPFCNNTFQIYSSVQKHIRKHHNVDDYEEFADDIINKLKAEFHLENNILIEEENHVGSESVKNPQVKDESMEVLDEDNVEFIDEEML